MILAKSAFQKEIAYESGSRQHLNLHLTHLFEDSGGDILPV
jgi:hypothetical protein